MSVMERIAHELIQEYGIRCTAKGCDCATVELSHILEQSKANSKICGEASLDMLGVNIYPLCKHHHGLHHAGHTFDLDDTKRGMLLYMAQQQLSRYIARCGR